MKKLGYELRIGNNYNYHDDIHCFGYPCKIIDIFHDGNNIIYEFKQDGKTGIGATIYPEKLKPIKP